MMPNTNLNNCLLKSECCLKSEIGNPNNVPVMSLGKFERLRGNTKIIITDDNHWLKSNTLLKSEIKEKMESEVVYFFMGEEREWLGFTSTMGLRKDFMIGLKLKNMKHSEGISNE